MFRKQYLFIISVLLTQAYMVSAAGIIEQLSPSNLWSGVKNIFSRIYDSIAGPGESEPTPETPQPIISDISTRDLELLFQLFGGLSRIVNEVPPAEQNRQIPPFFGM